MTQQSFDNPASLFAPDDEFLSGEDPRTDSARDASHWLEVYTNLIQSEEWLVDDGLPDANILKVRLRRLRSLKRRQQFWRTRQAEIRLTQRG